MLHVEGSTMITRIPPSTQRLGRVILPVTRRGSTSTSLDDSWHVAPRTPSDGRLLLRSSTAKRNSLPQVACCAFGMHMQRAHYYTGLTVRERNYLEVFPYDKWSDKELPQFQEGETFVPTECRLDEGKTSKPKLLTEPDLVSIMDEQGIGMCRMRSYVPGATLTSTKPGTDATIAQHIQTIIDRG